MLHVIQTGFVQMRHFGFLSNQWGCHEISVTFLLDIAPYFYYDTKRLYIIVNIVIMCYIMDV
jgi:hypothetical protein